MKHLHNRALLNYLISRGITGEIARPYLQEMYYQRDGKSDFALAFKNDAGGYELRNPYFKGTNGAKDVTLITGLVTVTDGDTLQLQDEIVRLHGIDAPEGKQYCRHERMPVLCGQMAARHLRELVDGKTVTCTGAKRDRYKDASPEHP